jgi:hypothetical protein
MFYIVNELKRPTIGRINVVIGFSVATVAAMYVVVIICAYGTYGNKLYSDMLLNYPGLPYVSVSVDTLCNRLYHVVTFLTTFARVLESANVCFHFPLQLFPAKKSIASLISHISGTSTENNISTHADGGPTGVSISAQRKYENRISVRQHNIVGCVPHSYCLFADSLHCLIFYNCILCFRSWHRVAADGSVWIPNGSIHPSR